MAAENALHAIEEVTNAHVTDDAFIHDLAAPPCEASAELEAAHGLGCGVGHGSL